MTVLFEIYSENANAPGGLERVGKVPLLDQLKDRRPRGSAWYVRPIKSPVVPFTDEERDAIHDWLLAEKIPGLMLINHPEVTDEWAPALLDLPSLTSVAWHGTSFSKKTVERLKKAGKSVDHADALWDAYEKACHEKETKDPRLTASSFYLGASPETHGLPGTLPRGKFPADYSLKLRSVGDGRLMHLSDVKGKVIILNFWATWCAPCRQEIPSLENLYLTLKDQKNVFFAYVAIQDAASVRAYLRDHPYKLPIYVANRGDTSAYTASGIPTTIVISKKGDWVAHQLGAAEWDTQLIMQTLLRLSNE